jgi:hypothetical protein
MPHLYRADYSFLLDGNEKSVALHQPQDFRNRGTIALVKMALGLKAGIHDGSDFRGIAFGSSTNGGHNIIDSPSAGWLLASIRAAVNLGRL